MKKFVGATNGHMMFGGVGFTAAMWSVFNQLHAGIRLFLLSPMILFFWYHWSRPSVEIIDGYLLLRLSNKTRKVPLSELRSAEVDIGYLGLTRRFVMVLNYNDNHSEMLNNDGIWAPRRRGKRQRDLREFTEALQNEIVSYSNASSVANSHDNPPTVGLRMEEKSLSTKPAKPACTPGAGQRFQSTLCLYFRIYGILLGLGVWIRLAGAPLPVRVGFVVLSGLVTVHLWRRPSMQVRGDDLILSLVFKKTIVPLDAIHSVEVESRVARGQIVGKRVRYVPILHYRDGKSDPLDKVGIWASARGARRSRSLREFVEALNQTVNNRGISG